MRRNPVVGWLLLLPAAAWIFGVTILPFFFAIRLSFMESALGIGPMTWVGIANYLRVFSDEGFWKSLLTSMVWLFSNLALQMTLPMAVALLLNRSFMGKNFARTVILTPWIIPAIVAAIIWRWMLEPSVGVINGVLAPILHRTISFLGDRNIALATVIGINTWKFAPLGIVLTLASLQTIPDEYYEAARIDGSSSWQEFRYVSFPMVGRMIWFVGLLGSIWVFNIVDLIWLLTQGGPGVATETLPVSIYRTAFKMLMMGKASAMAVLSALLLTAIGVVYFRFLQPKRDET